ncbi:MAG: MFS transporter [Bacteroidales bacterium]|jgi:DHA3 family macrolide efflux protein-like MFS transporter|nr:MFS transporter [Bacteroidales bacterium]
MWKKNIILFLTSQTLSLFGTMLVQYAIMWHIVLKTQSSSMMTLYIIVGVLPTFFTSLFGGVWADRYNKKHLINISDGSIAAVSLAIALSLFAEYNSMVLLMIAAAVRALGQGIQQPAVVSLIPLIVPDDKLLKINGINSSIQSGIFLISPVVSASLMSIAPLETLFFIDVITAALAIGILYFLVKVPYTQTKKEHAESNPFFKDLMNGLTYIKSEKYLLQLIIISAFYLIAMSPLSIMSPLQVTRNFGPDLWRLSAIEIVFAGGMMLGGVLVGIWSFRNKIYSIGMSASVFGILTILLGVWTHFIPYLVCMGICGILYPYYNAPNMTLLQEKVAPDYLGRVLSVFTMMGSLAMPVGMLFFGPLGDVININYIMIGTGIMMLLLGTLFFVNKTLREADSTNKKYAD